jgi:hypothetical protein
MEVPDEQGGGKRRGNPAWYRGMPSANPKGRPRGQNSIDAFYHNPELFEIKHIRWWRFCLELPLTVSPGNGAEAAKKAGYSPKSARFIASRLRKKPVIRAIFNQLKEMINATRKIDEGVFLIPDYSGQYHIYRNKKYR